MKKIFTLICVLCVAGFASAQNYTISQSTGTTSEFDYTGPNATSIFAGSSSPTDQISSTQTIPFTFNFYGQSVSSYKVSDNGYITFNTGASSSASSNMSLPSGSAPTNAIFAFWDALDVSSAGSGSPDEVISWTYGTTGNRVHVIEWFSVTPTGSTPSGQNFLYAAIRLYECGNFDVVLPFGATSSSSATIGAQDSNGSTGVQASGSPGISYPSNATSAQSDDVVYTFLWGGTNYDLSITSLDFESTVTVGNNTVSGEITNYGSQTVTSYDLHYTVNGGTAVTDNITGVSIAPGATTSFSHSTQWNVASGGQTFTLDVYADNINSGNSDQVTCNDNMELSLFSNTGTSGSKQVLVEEFTGAWCGYCPDGLLRLNDILNAHGEEKVSIVSIHTNDGMAFSGGLNIDTEFDVTGYPNAMVDRTLFDGDTKEPHSRTDWLTNTNTMMNAYTPVEVTVNHSYDAATRVVSGTIDIDYVDYAQGDMRVLLFIVEDSVVGVGSQYDQVNYYSSQHSSGGVGGPSHPFYNQPHPISGYAHRHTLRAVPLGATGQSGTIPSSTSPSDSYQQQFSTTLASSWDENQIYVVGAVAYYNSSAVGDRAVLNSDNEKLVESGVSVAKELNNVGVYVYPNPASDFATVKLGVNETVNADVVLMNQFGQVVKSIGSDTFNSGTHKLNFDVSDLASGVYMVNVRTENGSYTEKFIVTE